MGKSRNPLGGTTCFRLRTAYRNGRRNVLLPSKKSSPESPFSFCGRKRIHSIYLFCHMLRRCSYRPFCFCRLYIPCFMPLQCGTGFILNLAWRRGAPCDAPLLFFIYLELPVEYNARLSMQWLRWNPPIVRLFIHVCCKRLLPLRRWPNPRVLLRS